MELDVSEFESLDKDFLPSVSVEPFLRRTIDDTSELEARLALVEIFQDCHSLLHYYSRDEDLLETLKRYYWDYVEDPLQHAHTVVTAVFDDLVQLCPNFREYTVRLKHEILRRYSYTEDPAQRFELLLRWGCGVPALVDWGSYVISTALLPETGFSKAQLDSINQGLFQVWNAPQVLDNTRDYMRVECANTPLGYTMELTPGAVPNWYYTDQHVLSIENYKTRGTIHLEGSEVREGRWQRNLSERIAEIVSYRLGEETLMRTMRYGYRDLTHIDSDFYRVYTGCSDQTQFLSTQFEVLEWDLMPMGELGCLIMPKTAGFVVCVETLGIHNVEYLHMQDVYRVNCEVYWYAGIPVDLYYIDVPWELPV